MSDVVDLYSHVAEEKGIAIHYFLNETIWVNADIKRMIQALGNILDNAIIYSPPHSTIDIKTQIKGENVSILIQDHGPGILYYDF